MNANICRAQRSFHNFFGGTLTNVQQRKLYPVGARNLAWLL